MANDLIHKNQAHTYLRKNILKENNFIKSYYIMFIIQDNLAIFYHFCYYIIKLVKAQKHVKLS